MKPLDKLITRLNNGEISRREFLKNAGALGVASAVPASLLSGGTHAAEPKSGGHLRVATVQGSSTDQLDPTQLTSGHIGSNAGGRFASARWPLRHRY